MYHTRRTRIGLDELTAALRAAAEPTRLRLLAICAGGELTVSEITRVLGQSQPRVSRHLKLLCDAGLLERFREGSWVFYRLADEAWLPRALAERLNPDDPQLALDRRRIADVMAARARVAARYFRANAVVWDRIRSLHADERVVESALLDVLDNREIGALLDVGTGTGRVLELLAGRVGRGLGIDLSPEMLALARAKLESAGAHNCRVRQADMYALPLEESSYDAVIIHQVLHYADRPAAAIAEAARVLRDNGVMVIVDFAPHELEELRMTHKHRRLGFSDAEVSEWFAAAGLIEGPARRVPGAPLTVTIWHAAKPAAAPAIVGGGPGWRQRAKVAA